MQVAVLIPTLRRAFRLRAVANNVMQSDSRCVPVFICEAEDEESIETVDQIEGAQLVINVRARSYAGAINTAVAWMDSDWFFLGSDDLDFRAGWLDSALAVADGFDVVGTNDLHNPEVLNGTHSTHSLVRGSYARNGCVDVPDVCLFEGYRHNWCDTEFIATASARGVFVPCLDSVVEHLHWVWGNNVMDSTYDKGRLSEGLDRQLFSERQKLWNGI